MRVQGSLDGGNHDVYELDMLFVNFFLAIEVFEELCVNFFLAIEVYVFFMSWNVV